MTFKRTNEIIENVIAKKLKSTTFDNDIENDDDRRSINTNNNNEFIKRENRSKNFKIFNAITSTRETQSIKTQKKKFSQIKTITKILISMKIITINHDRIIFLNNHIKKFVVIFYRKFEKIESMIHFWSKFFRVIQFLRNQIKTKMFTKLIEIEIKIINLQNIIDVYSKMIITKKVLKFKNNYKTFTINV